MNEYLQNQISLLGNFRIALRIAGIFAGVVAAVGPFLIATAGLSGSFGTNTSDALLIAISLLLGVPIGIDFMCLAITLRGRLNGLKLMDAATDNHEKFNGFRSNHLAKLRINRVVLWGLGGLILLQAINVLQSTLGIQGVYYFSEPIGLTIGLLCLLIAGIHIYLGFLLSRQLKDLTPPVEQAN